MDRASTDSQGGTRLQRETTTLKWASLKKAEIQRVSRKLGNCKDPKERDLIVLAHEILKEKNSLPRFERIISGIHAKRSKWIALRVACRDL